MRPHHLALEQRARGLPLDPSGGKGLDMSSPTGAMLISLGTDAASDSWGFVGVVRVGDVEAYRTMEAYGTPGEALRATQELMASVLGETLAGTEWRTGRDKHGHAPTRRDLGLGLFARSHQDGQAQGPPDIKR